MVFKKSQGFTIVELMIAMTTFTVAVTLITTGVIFIGRQYKQAVTRVDLESASREIHQQVAQSIQFSGADAQTITPPGDYSATCIGDKQYIYGTSQADYDAATYDALNSGLYYKDIPEGSCPGIDTTNLGINLLPDGAKVVAFDYNSFVFSTVFVYSDSDLINVGSTPTADQIACKGGVSGREYCAVVKLDSSVARKVTK